jgi:nucleoside-diphosphate-sugar epimerase
MYEELMANVRAAPPRAVAVDDVPAEPPPAAKTVVVTGVRGFVGSRVAKSLAAAGYRVRGISRTPDPDQPCVHEWVTADLADYVPDDAFAGAEAVVHAAAETSGGYEEHQRNTIGAARRVLRAMANAGVTRLVHVSTLSVLQPALFRRLDERSPLVYDPRSMGPYAWGKTLSEVIVRFEAKTLGVEVRTVRPGSLVDLHERDIPGLLGRRLFGRWHLGLGWPGLRIPVCPVDRCAAAIAWCVARFDDAPEVVNVLDRAVRNRGHLLSLLRENGWDGRMIWVPIWAISAAFHGVRLVTALARGTLPQRRAVWSVLRPQRYDYSASEALLSAADDVTRESPESIAVS